ncbi:MAG: hypothetical protein ABW130_07075 [Candidatus Thiodiazotropha lotti]
MSKILGLDRQVPPQMFDLPLVRPDLPTPPDPIRDTFGPPEMGLHRPPAGPRQAAHQ